MCLKLRLLQQGFNFNITTATGKYHETIDIPQLMFDGYDMASGNPVSYLISEDGIGKNIVNLYYIANFRLDEGTKHYEVVTDGTPEGVEQAKTEIPELGPNDTAEIKGINGTGTSIRVEAFLDKGIKHYYVVTTPNGLEKIQTEIDKKVTEDHENGIVSTVDISLVPETSVPNLTLPKDEVTELNETQDTTEGIKKGKQKLRNWDTMKVQRLQKLIR